jgi:hypothetical protein
MLTTNFDKLVPSAFGVSRGLERDGGGQLEAADDPVSDVPRLFRRQGSDIPTIRHFEPASNCFSQLIEFAPFLNFKNDYF